MADVAKTVKVVSNSSAGGVSLCELTSTNIEADSLELHNPQTNNSESSELTLNLPSPDEGTSLQELIESELALRKELIESQFSPRISEFEITDTVEVNQKNGSSPKSSPPQNYDDGDYETIDINTQFILAERNHSFQSFTGNDMFFFNTLDDTQMNGADPGLADPYLEEEPNITSQQESSESESATDSSVMKDGLDQIALSTFDPFTTIVDSSKSEPIDNPDIVETPSSECADSDFICQADCSNGGGVDPEEGGLVEEIPTNEVVSVDVNNSMEEFECGSNDVTQTVDRLVTNIFDTLEIDDDELPITPDESIPKLVEIPMDSHMTIPEIDIIPPDDNDISESELVSNEELSIASNDHGGVSGGFDMWTTLAEGIDEDVAGTSFDVAGTSNTGWTSIIESAEIETIGEKLGGNDVVDEADERPGSLIEDIAVVHAEDVDDDVVQDVCSKSTDSSHSDSEKSEVVVTKTTEKKTKKKKSEGGESTKTKKTKKTKKSDPEKENISVANKGLTNVDSVVISEVKVPSKDHTPTEGVVDDDLSNVSVKVLKSTYANQILSPKDTMKEVDEDIQHCGPIQSLRRSFGDLSTLCDIDEGEVGEQDSAPISSDTRASYCSLANLTEDGNIKQLQQRASCSNLADFSPPKKLLQLQQKSSFSKFDQLSKKTVLHVRSVDASKAQKQFNQTAETTPEQTSNCRSCGKQVFQMEQVKAERAVWHKNCFRCKECNKQLTLDIYSSHEGQLYCKPHFRELFKPKAVVEEEAPPPRYRKPELIIRENQPIELPPEVVRASDKPDLGLEELSALNVKSRYQVFEKCDGPEGAEVERSPSSVSVKRSPSILSKLARFQAKGMDIGVTDDSLNGIPYEESSSSSEEDEEIDGEEGGADRDLIRSNRKQRERPVSFSKMEDIKCRWESGQAAWREEQRQERKQEIQNIRSRLFLGKQGKMKEMYEQAVKDSENISQKKEVGIRSEKAKSIKERFERGEVLPDEDATEDDEHKKGMDEDMSVFEAGISKKSRSLFLELDATAAKTQQQQPALMSPLKSPLPKDDARRRSREDNSPDREIYRDPDIVRSEDRVEDEEVMKTNTAKKMLSIFRQLEENATKDELPDGPKPLKRFTPPPDYTRESESEEEETESEEEEEEEEEEEDVNPNLVRASDKIEDEFLKQAQNAARAKALRAKFERWEEKENRANANAATNASHAVGNLNGSLELDQSSEHTSIDTTKSLRARFESLKNETQQPKEKMPRPKVNRFVEIQTSCAEFCSVCEKKVYPLEKVETGGKLFHKQCFRCLQCNCILRMETYTLNNGKLYCIPHFKQLFIAKGNYEEGFGLDQHKRKWNNRNNNEDDLLNSINNGTDH